MRILIVEDDPINRVMFEEQLALLGYTMHSCINAETALEEYQQRSYPLIVVDLGLPGMDGFEFIRHIRALPQGDRSMIVDE